MAGTCSGPHGQQATREIARTDRNRRREHLAIRDLEHRSLNFDIRDLADNAWLAHSNDKISASVELGQRYNASILSLATDREQQQYNDSKYWAPVAACMMENSHDYLFWPEDINHNSGYKNKEYTRTEQDQKQ